MDAFPEDEAIPGLDVDEQIKEYLRGAFAIIDSLCENGIITIEQAEEARTDRFDYAHDTFGMKIIGGDIDGTTSV